MKKESIKIELSRTDVCVGRIVILQKDRNYFNGEQNVKIKDKDYHIYDSGSSLYISGFKKLHIQNKAQEGTVITLTYKGKKQYEIQYETNNRIETHNAVPTSRQIDESNFPVLGDLSTVLEKMQASYKGIMVDQDYFPSRDKIGFTERNLTFFFCHHYVNLRRKNIQNIIVWQEMPLESSENQDNHRQHIDSIIIDKQDNKIDIFYIEAKRIYGPKSVNSDKNSLKADYGRIMKITQTYQAIKKLPKINTKIFITM